MTRRWLQLPLLLAAACTHTEPFTFEAAANPPRTTGADVQLTYNADQDYWPAWTQDGRGILYAFVDPDAPQHRCIGLIAPAGGSRTWQLCRTQAAYDDSSASFTAFAVDSSGRLLYVEATTPFVAGIPAASQAQPYNMNLWLADTAKPFQRTGLLSLPTSVDGVSVSWLGDIAWTGPNSFIALGQSYAIVRHCFGTGFPADPACDMSDTVLSSGTISPIGQGVVVRGIITNGQATLSSVAGTNGATSYALAEGGTSIVFAKRDDSFLYKVPAAGGTITSIGNAAASAQGGYQVLGVSCFASTCIAATDVVTLTRLEPTKIFPVLTPGARELRTISLVSDLSAGLGSYTTVISSLAISPHGGDAVLQVGGMWGHLQTYEGSSASDLHLLKGVVQ